MLQNDTTKSQIQIANLVVVFSIGNLDDHLLETTLLPCDRRMLDHGIDGVIKLLIFVVQEHKLVPQVSLRRMIFDDSECHCISMYQPARMHGAPWGC